MLRGSKQRKPRQDLMRQNFYEVITSSLERNATTVQLSEKTSMTGGILRKLPDELIHMIIDQALLGLTNTTYSYIVGENCWRTIAEPEHEAEKLEFLCLFKIRASHTHLMCSHCITFHRVNCFEAEEQGRGPRSRVCNLKYGEVDLSNNVRITRSEVQQIPDNALLKHRSTTQLLPFVKGNEDSDNISHHVYAGWTANVDIEIMQINSVLYAQTRYEFPGIPDMLEFDRFTYEITGICVAICPHTHWGSLASLDWSVCKLSHKNGEPCSECIYPVTCGNCKTEFAQEVQTLSDGREHYFTTTWRDLGGDKDPMNRA